MKHSTALPSFAINVNIDVAHSLQSARSSFPRGAMAKSTAYIKCKSLQSKHSSAKQTEKVHMKGSRNSFYCCATCGSTHALAPKAPSSQLQIIHKNKTNSVCLHPEGLFDITRNVGMSYQIKRWMNKYSGNLQQLILHDWIITNH